MFLNVQEPETRVFMQKHAETHVFEVDVCFIPRFQLRSRPETSAGLVFVNALEVEQLPEAEIQISAALRLG